MNSLAPLLEAVVSFIEEGVLITDTQGAVIYQNPAAGAILGFDPSEPVQDIRRLHDLNLAQSLMRVAVAAGEIDDEGRPTGAFMRIAERVMVGDDCRYLEFHSGLVDIAGGQRLRLVMIQDKTERKRLEAVIAKGGHDEIISADAVMLEIISRLWQIAPTQASVLLLGESGTGKTQVARMIHHYSNRSQYPFVEVNCAAIPGSLIESELFGHVRGAFTGATSNRPGRFQAAHRGTLFLDEVSEIPLNLQAKLLRVLQERVFEPVGSDQPVQVDVRVIAATNRNLRKMVEDGEFRADLYYRLAVIPLNIPPLRERQGDIPLLVRNFIHGFVQRGYPLVSVSAGAMRSLLDYPWPGNVRELINAVEHGMICAENGLITENSLPHDIRHHFHAGKAETRIEADTTPDDGEMQRRAEVISALQLASGNRALAAKILGVDRSTLWRKMQRYGIASAESAADKPTSEQEK